MRKRRQILHEQVGYKTGVVTVFWTGFAADRPSRFFFLPFDQLVAASTIALPS